MKILLLQPPLIQTANAAQLAAADDGDNSRIGLGLYSLATQLMAAGHTVRLANHSLTTWEESLRDAAAFVPDLAGLTCYTHQRQIVAHWGEAFRQRAPGCRQIVGGVHATFLYREILDRWPWVDWVAVGEADDSLPELVARLERGEATTGIPGLAGRAPTGGLDWCGPAAPVTELGRLPIPAEHFPYNIISTSRGCPFNCSFCCSPEMWGRRVRERPVEHVIRELELLRRRHGIRYLNFKDETFTARASRVREICQAIIDSELHILWSCDTRVDCLDEERLYWLRRAGCHVVSFGVESGSPRLLEAIDKRTTLDKVAQATALARRYGMHVRYYLIAGLPGETATDLQASWELVERNRPHYACISKLIVSPGTHVWEQYATEFKVDAAA